MLAGGTGTRLHGVTGGGNKHLLPIAGRPALLHVLAPIRATYPTAPGVLVTNPQYVEAMQALLEEAELAHWKVVAQPQPDGTLSAVRCALALVSTPAFNVNLGDNLFSWRRIPEPGAAFRAGAAVELFTREVPAADSERFAVVTIAGHEPEGPVISVIEKPPAREPLANYRALAGLANFKTADFLELAPQVAQSVRGEYEITSYFDRCIREGRGVYARTVAHDWIDYGTPESYREAERVLRAREEA